jgi:hypothetical protein
VPGAHFTEIEEIFDGKIEYLKSSIEAVKLAPGEGDINSGKVEDIKLEQLASLDKVNFITSFEEIGLIDPFSKDGRKKTEKHIGAMGMNSLVYPDKLMTGPMPPKCVFVPDRNLMRKIIKQQVNLL